MTPTITTNAAKAFNLALLGLSVFPCTEQKTPYVTGGHLSATTDAEQIADWWGQHPDALVGVRMGDGILAIDIDRHAGGADGFTAITDEGVDLPRTLHYPTRTNGGEHHLYRAPEGAWRHDPLPGVNVRAGGSYVIWWGEAPDALALADAPAWAVAQRRTTGDANPFAGDVAAWLAANAQFGRDAATTYAYLPGLDEVLLLAGQDSPDITDARMVGVLFDLIREGAAGYRVTDAIQALRDLWARDEWATDRYRARFDGVVSSAICEVGGAMLTEAVLAPEVEAEAEPEAAGNEPFRLVTRSELRNRPKPQWLVQGLVQGAGVVILAGDPGIGKTFLAIDWAAHIATGKPWCGRPVAAGRVLYVAAEGVEFFDDRLTAWEAANGRTVDDSDLLYVEEGFSLSDERAVDHMVSLVKSEEFTLVVLDTLSQLSSVEDENAAAQIANTLRAARRIRQARPGTSVLVVHHTNKGTGKVRGSTAIRGNADAVIVAKGEKGSFAISTRASDDGKQKNAPAERLDGFYLRTSGESAVIARQFGSDEAEAVDAVLADGEWHPVSEMLDRIGKDDEATRKRVIRRLEAVQAEKSGSNRHTQYMACPREVSERNREKPA